MKKNAMNLIALCCVAAFGTGCPDVIHECDSDADCPEELICEYQFDITGDVEDLTLHGRSCIYDDDIDTDDVWYDDTADFMDDGDVYCPEIWDPVCGEDGETYSSECYAELADVEIIYEGECLFVPPPLTCDDIECSDGFVCVEESFDHDLESGPYCIEEPVEPGECFSDADCTENEDCVFIEPYCVQEPCPSPESGICMPSNEQDECYSNDDCSDGYECIILEIACPTDIVCPGYCEEIQLPQVECYQDDDCNEDQICEYESYCSDDQDCLPFIPESGVCIDFPIDPPTGECDTNEDCEDGYECIVNEIYCLAESCPENVGFCVEVDDGLTCDNIDCADEQVCQMTLHFGALCEDDGDCWLPECVAACDSDDQCGDHEECVLPEQPCRTDFPCGFCEDEPGLTCDNVDCEGDCEMIPAFGALCEDGGDCMIPQCIEG